MFKSIIFVIKKWWLNRFSDKKLLERYIAAGTQFGDAVSMIYMGECIGFGDLLKEWEITEDLISKRGYRAISLDDFVGHGGWGKSLPPIKKRAINEKVYLHAAFYRKHYLGKMQMSSAIKDALEGKASAGYYEVPSTRHLGSEQDV
jgi:hypothetical protein